MFTGPHQHTNVHGLSDADLAAEAELAQYSIFFEALVLLLAHLGFGTVEFHAASGAPRLPAAAVAHIDAILFQRQYQLCSIFHGKLAETFYLNCMCRHRGARLPNTIQWGVINESRLVQLFKELCLIDAPAYKEKESVAFVKPILEQMGLEVHEDQAGEKIGGNANNLIAVWKGDIADAPRIFLSAHFDTVEPTAGLVIKEENGVIASSGNTILGADDKSGMAPIIEAIRCMQEAGESHGDVVLLFSVAEEVGLKGADALELQDLNLDYGYVLDTGPPVGSFVNRTATHDKLEIVVHGKPAHAGKDPEKGINAIQVASEAIAQMKLGRIGPETTANLGVISGGSATNVVCSKVTILAEARSTNVQELDDQVDHMVQLFEAAATKFGTSVEIKHVRHYNSYHVPVESEVVQVALQASRNLGLDPKLRTTLGGSDANIFNAKGLPSIVVATGMEKIHTHEEFITREDLVKGTKLTIELIREAARRRR